MMRTFGLLAGLMVALGVPLALIAHKEQVVASGTTMLLPLAPRDPRSLIQGDYMALRYALPSDLLAQSQAWPRDGALVVRLDATGVATFVRRHAGEPLAGGEHLLRYRRRGMALRLGAESFFFQEGQARVYERARYGELKVSPNGESVLVGLRDDRREVLGQPLH